MMKTDIATILEKVMNGGGPGGGSPCTDGGEEVGTRWIVSEDEFRVCDKMTNLTWQHSPSNTGVNLPGADAFCKTLFPPMRVPTEAEFLTLLETTVPPEATSLPPTDAPFVFDLGGYWTTSCIGAGNTTIPCSSPFPHTGDPALRQIILGTPNPSPFGTFSQALPIGATLKVWCIQSGP